ncbi:MAG: hypothetical protein J0I12_07910 [Candidatus Eremiobacteraeota bacterium]|nr:hypothetical protein [Candidatus Eremiobacteraeota bacterium]
MGRLSPVGFAYLFCMLCLCLPALINGAPLLFTDIVGYVKWSSDFFQNAPFGCTDMARSPTYSLVMLKPFLGDKFWPVILLHCLAVVGVLDFTTRKFWGGPHPLRLCLLVLGLTLTTPLAVMTDFAMPDIFAGLLLLLLYWLGPGQNQTTGRQRSWLILAASLFITFHGSNWLLTLALVVVGRSRHLGLALLGASLLSISLNVLAFGRLMLFPVHPPFAVARTLDFDLAQRYFRNHPESKRFHLYAYRRHLPPDASYFLWGDRSPLRRLDEAQRIRAEEMSLYLSIWRAYPRECLDMALESSLNQLGCFSLWELWGVHLPEYFTHDLGPRMDYVANTWQPQNRWPVQRMEKWYRRFFCLALIWSLFDRRVSRPLLLWCLFGLVVNAAVCGTLSGVYARYQCRVQWLAVLPALLAVLRPRLLNAARSPD